MSDTAGAVDAGVEAAVRVSQGYCIYAGCFPLNVIPPPLPFWADLALAGVASRVPAIGFGGKLGTGPGGAGLIKEKKRFGVKPTGKSKFNLATAWVMGDGLGAPYAVGEAASKWFDASEKLSQASSQLRDLVLSLSADQWSGKDREAFNEEVKELALQIDDAAMFARIVGGCLVTGCIPLGVWPLGCSIVGVIQFVNASMFYAAVASIVGNLGPSEALYATGLASSVTCNRSLSTGAKAVSAVLAVSAIVIAGAAIANASAQQEHGDEDAFADLGRAVVEMTIEQAVKNLAASGINALTPGPLDVVDVIVNPEDHIGKNNDPTQEWVDEHLGGPAEDLGNRGGDVVFGDDEPDRGPFSAG